MRRLHGLLPAIKMHEAQTLEYSSWTDLQGSFSRAELRSYSLDAVSVSKVSTARKTFKLIG